jgi:hypothetical protein
MGGGGQNIIWCIEKGIESHESNITIYLHLWTFTPFLIQNARFAGSYE